MFTLQISPFKTYVISNGSKGGHSNQWGKTRSKNPDGAATQVGSFPPYNCNVDLEL